MQQPSSSSLLRLTSIVYRISEDFRSHVREFLGCILSPFRPSLPLRFPVREGSRKAMFDSFSTVSDDTLGSFWAAFCRRSVLHCHCVSPCSSSSSSSSSSNAAAAAAAGATAAVGNCFLEAVQNAAAAGAATQVTVAAEAAATAVGSRMCRKMLLLCGFRRHVREFFGAVLGFARLSGAWCFPAGRCFFWGSSSSSSSSNAAAAAAAATAAVGNCFLEAVQYAAAAAAAATQVTVAAEAAATAVGSRATVAAAAAYSRSRAGAAAAAAPELQQQH